MQLGRKILVEGLVIPQAGQGLFLESPGNVSGPESYFMYALFTLKIKVSITLTMI